MPSIILIISAPDAASLRQLTNKGSYLEELYDQVISDGDLSEDLHVLVDSNKSLKEYPELKEDQIKFMSHYSKETEYKNFGDFLSDWV